MDLVAPSRDWGWVERVLKSEQEASDREELTAILVLGVTFPSGEMQQQLVSSLYKECGIEPGEVEYVEAHGTGTKVSMDPLGLFSSPLFSSLASLATLFHQIIFFPK